MGRERLGPSSDLAGPCQLLEASHADGKVSWRELSSRAWPGLQNCEQIKQLFFKPLHFRAVGFIALFKWKPLYIDTHW